MKTTTKALIFSIALIPSIMLIFSFTKPASETKYATMRTIEVPVAGKSKIILIYDGKIEEFELGELSISNHTANTLQINQAINKLASTGYELVSQSGGQAYNMYSFVQK
ncbi:MAG: hypothetical protein M3Q58_02580 [Bacteroidota bacterium]|nr:hypothetical protein [Bacteroidota bacterium]